MSAATATTQTFAVIFKERMMDMPDELNAKKDIDEYSKKITKEIKEEAKNNKIEKAEKKKDEKKKKKNNLDEDGNEKPKKPLTKYQQYIRDNQQRIRDEFPELSNTERFSKLAEEWKAYKATLENAEDAGEATGEAGEATGEATGNGNGDADVTDMEITNVSEDDEEKPKKAANAAKAAKKPKKEIKPKAKAEADE
uniref:HMG box domain-containing protein n=1 Tax=viral metagenome TaxID=1070528 RepID=A0A6C0L9X5_9ZZZZ